MNNATHPPSVKIPAAICILLITLVIVGAIVFTQRDMVTTSTATMTPSTNQANTSGQSYKDGTYVEDGSYSSPAGTEKISVSLTIANNMVSSSTVTRGATDPTASSYQGLFISGYKEKVDGKKVGEINLTNVAGSSLTPKGFMDALHKIELDAKA